jgi:small subunit ribosomal protein S21
MKMRTAFEKPSERRTREKAEAVRRARKTERKRLQREGVLPAPKKKEKPGMGRGGRGEGFKSGQSQTKSDALI